MDEGLWGWVDVHIGTKLAQRLVEVVHLREDAHHDDDGEDVGARVAELVASSEGKFQGDAEAFDGHDGYAAHGAADGNIDHRVRFAVPRCDAVDHDDSEDRHDGAVEEEACPCSIQLASPYLEKERRRRMAHRVVGQKTATAQHSSSPYRAAHAAQ